VTRISYQSETYNPHALLRRWGFLHSAALRDACNHNDARRCRKICADSLLIGAQQLPGTPLSSHPGQGKALKTPGKIIWDSSIENPATLIGDIGADIFSLVILADVPLYRDTRIGNEQCIGHWRWLRRVWAFFTGNKVSVPPSCPEPAFSDCDLVLAPLADQAFHIAIAQLRTLFHALPPIAPDQNRAFEEHIRFLYLLNLFCPYIGHELLYRYGVIESPAEPES
jgi:hypothetical protein